MDNFELEGKETPKKKSVWKRVVVIILLLLLLAVIAVGVAVAMYLDHLMGQVNVVPKDESTISSSDAADIMDNDPGVETVPPNTDETLPKVEDITFPTETTEEQWVKNENVINIMLIGQDREPGESRARSDSMILATCNLESKTITLTSFLRDAYVQIPGYAPQKLNHAYAFGGMKLLNETLRINYGVIVDGDVEVDFSGFENLIDMLGGVTINLTAAEAEHLEPWGWGLTSGVNRLTGEQALYYSRIRYIDTDYRRTERQRTVIMSVINEYKTKAIGEMLQILEDALPMVTTNMEKGEIMDYALKVGPMLAGANFQTMQIPAPGTFRAGNVEIRPGYQNWFEYDIDFAYNRQLLREIFAAT